MVRGQLGRQIAVILRRPRIAAGERAVVADEVARKGLEDLVRQVERLEMRLNLILAAIVGTLVVDVLKAIVR